ncbi:MAG: excalibur calcium-binding domain-containing protein, partial [Nocardioides sp.]
MSPRRRGSFAALLLSILVALGALTAVPAQGLADRDCGDFATQKGAQDFFINQGGPGSDPHALDAEGDGIACESNPCPCSTYQGGGGGGGTEPSPDPVKKQR